jgi:hypothetical protein
VSIGGNDGIRHDFHCHWTAKFVRLCKAFDADVLETLLLRVSYLNGSQLRLPLAAIHVELLTTCDYALDRAWIFRWLKVEGVWEFREVFSQGLDDRLVSRNRSNEHNEQKNRRHVIQSRLRLFDGDR